jgi:hypothetical protein
MICGEYRRPRLGRDAVSERGRHNWKIPGKMVKRHGRRGSRSRLRHRGYAARSLATAASLHRTQLAHHWSAPREENCRPSWLRHRRHARRLCAPRAPPRRASVEKSRVATAGKLKLRWRSPRDEVVVTSFWFVRRSEHCFCGRAASNCQAFRHSSEAMSPPAAHSSTAPV